MADSPLRQSILVFLAGKTAIRRHRVGKGAESRFVMFDRGNQQLLVGRVAFIDLVSGDKTAFRLVNPDFVSEFRGFGELPLFDGAGIRIKTARYLLFKRNTGGFKCEDITSQEQLCYVMCPSHAKRPV